MPIRKSAHKDTETPGGCVNYMDSPNRAKYLSEVIHRMIASDQEDKKAQETLNNDDAPTPRTEAEMRLSVLLGALQSLYEEEWPWIYVSRADDGENILIKLKAIIDSA